MSYKKLGKYIKLIDNRNRDLSDAPLLGVSVQKRFITSVANTIGSDMSKYKLIEKNNFVYIPDTSRRGDKIGIALLKDFDEAMISQAYTSFKIIDENELSPDYLMMWFSRPEFDRYARYHSIGSVREVFDWKDMCEVELPIPSIEEQRKIVAQYQSIANKIKVNEQICEKLEATAQALYKHWFVDFEFPSPLTPNGGIVPYKSSGGKMVWNEELGKEIPEGWEVGKLETVSNLKYGKMLDSDKFLTAGYPVFSGYGVRGYYSEYMYEEPQILVLCRGVSGTGEVKLSPNFSYITNLSIVVELQENVMSKFFTYYYLKNDDLRTLDSGSAQSMITTGDLYFRNILKPKYTIQVQFDNQISKLHNCKEILKRQNQKLAQLQSLLLSRLAVGEEEKKKIAV
ncbi:restriction endonuclease subunit S [Paenimyroides aestuarii]|uniref:Restriction endonuclease subunit S n=1 Tax=Paenimyroides aestuarii TaxID=2968490 RepID=A0ABY5NQQ1_9FLAO|nr:restriction endonuclease subunit S [Paenimyroides aestuarii]UUV20889.1 restriction endonuclease subunit S [Paenimyroides aestuarii]